MERRLWFGLLGSSKHTALHVEATQAAMSELGKSLGYRAFEAGFSIKV